MDKQFKPCKGSRTLGRVVVGLGYNINSIIFDNASLPDDSTPPVYNNMTECDEVGDVPRDKFDLLNKIGVISTASGMGTSQAQVVDA